MTRNYPSNATLAETVDRVTDKGVVIDGWARLSVVDVDLEPVAVDGRGTVASLDTYRHCLGIDP